jgi:hypothetical protein
MEYNNPVSTTSWSGYSRPSDPVIIFDRVTQVVEIDGCRFSRELLAHLTASEPGEWFRIIARKDGVITVERSTAEIIAGSVAKAGASC